MRALDLFCLVVPLAVAGCSPAGPVVINTSGQDLATPGPDLAMRPPDLATVCGQCPAESPICDVPNRKCVGCLSDNDCPAATVCKNKQCAPGCSANRSQCGDAGSCDLDAGVCHGCLSDRDCKDIKAPSCDVVSGRCYQCVPDNDRCPAGAYCAESQGGYACMLGCRVDADCQQVMGPNAACCAHQCVDISTSKDHCGSCGAPCGNGTCCNKRCIDAQSDVVNCGGCGKVCPAMNNMPQCKAGQCSSGACVNGFADCDSMPGNGCEVSVNSDRSNCGSCGMACAAPNADTLCLGGGCTLGGCKPGFRDCNMSYGDGCEASVLNDPNNCGACGANCGAVPHARASCVNGMCTVGQCDPGFGNCNNVDNDGCEADVLADQKNCGACGKVCPGPANTVIQCNGGVCGAPGACLPAFKDCDNNMNNGCEIDINNDPKNCGSCGGSCGAAVNAVAACKVGVCSFTCNNGYGDCDGNKNNGCEALLASDKSNCGACGVVCPQNLPVCLNSKCAPSVLKSCKDFLDQGLSMGDGVYTIDPDGMGPNPGFKIYCDMTTDGGGWEVQAYIRKPAHWDWMFYTDNGVVGDTAGGFSSSATLQSANDSFNEKIIIYLNLIENGGSLGKQWMIVRRKDNVAIPYNTLQANATGWAFRDSYGKTDADAGNICTHGCDKFRGHGMFHDNTGISWNGTQGGDYGCRDGNNICWVTRGQGCNVGAGRCAYITGNGEGVIYAVRNK